MRIAVLDDFHGVFDTDPAIARLRRRAPVDVFTESVGTSWALVLAGHPDNPANYDDDE
jgi:hypothetical protein